MSKTKKAAEDKLITKEASKLAIAYYGLTNPMSVHHEYNRELRNAYRMGFRHGIKWHKNSQK